MKTLNLKTRITVVFLGAILVLGTSMSVFGFYLIQKYVVGKAQLETDNHLKAIHTVYFQELSKLRVAFDVADPKRERNRLREDLGVDYLNVAKAADPSIAGNRIAEEALKRGVTLVATRVMSQDELKRLDPAFVERFAIVIQDTPQASPTDQKALSGVLTMECARPVFDEATRTAQVLYGGRIINKNHDLIELMSGAVFEDDLYQSKPVGTVTIFQDDTRVTTTVLDKTGNFAVGTRISERVYDQVIKKGQSWLDRAFVVTDWYLTAYEPIRDIDGRVIGALYLGLLEKPYLDLRSQILFAFWAMITAVLIFSLLLSSLLAGSISQPLVRMLNAIRKVAGGDLKGKIAAETEVRELDELVHAFNGMADKIREREQRLGVSNEKLAQLNKNYLDLIGFVTHELKGILASATLNAYTVRDGYLGLVNFKQRKALDSVAKNLDYLTATVDNFLNLSRIEKGELQAHLKPVLLREEIFDEVVETFSKQASVKEMTITNRLPAGLQIKADPDLLKIAAHNLVANAIKYGTERSEILIDAHPNGTLVKIEVYNEGCPLSDLDLDKLFKKFSRLATDSKKNKGTGLGLFITKEIVEKHGGTLYVEPKVRGNSFIFSIPKEEAT